MSAVFKRELKAYFNGPIGYVILAVFALFSGIFFSAIYMQGEPRVESVISALGTVVIFIVPFITMRLLSEDRKQKVDQVLLTAPVSVTAVVLGKFFAALSLYGIGFGFTLIFQLIVTANVSVNWLVYLYALLGAMLFGAALISVGMFISSLTESSVVSAAITLALFLVLLFAKSFASLSSLQIVEKAVDLIAFPDRFSNFVDGLFNPTDIVYMLSIAVLFVFLTIRSTERRRWA